MTVGILTPDSDETSFFLGHAPEVVRSYEPIAGWDEVEIVDIGALDFETDFPIDSFELEAIVTPTFFEDWYNRFHVVPQRFDLANIIGDQSRDILIWNAYLASKEITNASYPSGVGIEVVDPVGVPYTLAPLEDVSYTLVVNAEGPPAIDTGLEWTIGGEVLEVPITGRRIVIWPFGPNWSSPFVESLDWLTDVFTAFSGDEQRRQLRTKPRRMFEYSLRAKKADAAIMRNLLWGWQDRNFAVPLWQDRTTLQAGVSPGGESLSIDTSTRGFYEGGLLVLFVDTLDYEVVEVETVSADSVALAKPLERSWAAGTFVYPINICRMPMSVTAQRLTDGVEVANVTFNADPLQTNPNIPLVAASTTHAGYEVILRKPNWAQPIQIENLMEYEPIDFKVGGVLTEPRREFPQVIRRFQWVLKSRADAYAHRALLGRLRGRFKAAYLPTWFDDFELFEDVVASSSTIPIKNNEFLSMVGSNPALNTLMILVHGQDPIIRSIDSVGSDPEGFTALGLNAAIGHDLNASTLRRISLVHLCRLASDRVTINWLSDSKATVEANFALVKA